MGKRLQYRNGAVVGVAGLVFAVCLSGFGLGHQGESATTNTGLTIQVTASRSVIKLPPRPADLRPLDCEPTEDEVRLSANATSPYKTEMNFNWQVPVGRLIGKGRNVTWDLSGVQEGSYTATVDASDKHKHTASSSVKVAVVVCPGWRPDPPPCPTISVSCPSTVDSKEPVTFEADVVGGDPEIASTYKWSLSAEKKSRVKRNRKSPSTFLVYTTNR